MATAADTVRELEVNVQNVAGILQSSRRSLQTPELYNCAGAVQWEDLSFEEVAVILRLYVTSSNLAAVLTTVHHTGTSSKEALYPKAMTALGYPWNLSRAWLNENLTLWDELPSRSRVAIEHQTSFLFHPPHPPTSSAMLKKSPARISSVVQELFLRVYGGVVSFVPATIDVLKEIITQLNARPSVAPVVAFPRRSRIKHKVQEPCKELLSTHQSLYPTIMVSGRVADVFQGCKTLAQMVYRLVVVIEQTPTVAPKPPYCLLYPLLNHLLCTSVNVLIPTTEPIASVPILRLNWSMAADGTFDYQLSLPKYPLVSGCVGKPLEFPIVPAPKRVKLTEDRSVVEDSIRISRYNLLETTRKLVSYWDLGVVSVPAESELFASLRQHRYNLGHWNRQKERLKHTVKEEQIDLTAESS